MIVFLFVVFIRFGVFGTSWGNAGKMRARSSSAHPMYAVWKIKQTIRNAVKHSRIAVPCCWHRIRIE